MNKITIVAGLIFFSTGFVFGQTEENFHNALLILEANSIKEMNVIIEELEQNNGKIIHRYPPEILIGRFPDNLLNRLSNRLDIKEVINGVVDETAYSFLSQTGQYALYAWNNNFMGLSKGRGLDGIPGPDVVPLSNCIIMKNRVEEVKQHPARSNAPFGAGFEDVSEFLLGEISVAIFFPESDGTNDPSTEDWSASREASSVSEIQNGLDWLANENPNANLSFTYHFYYGRTNPDAQTQWEPIIS